MANLQRQKINSVAASVAVIIAGLALITSSVQTYILWSSRNDYVLTQIAASRLSVCFQMLERSAKYNSDILTSLTFFKHHSDEFNQSLEVTQSQQHLVQENLNLITAEIKSLDEISEEHRTILEGRLEEIDKQREAAWNSHEDSRRSYKERLTSYGDDTQSLTDEYFLWLISMVALTSPTVAARARLLAESVSKFGNDLHNYVNAAIAFGDRKEEYETLLASRRELTQRWSDLIVGCGRADLFQDQL